jgi:hypothetical protein
MSTFFYNFDVVILTVGNSDVDERTCHRFAMRGGKDKFCLEATKESCLEHIGGHLSSIGFLFLLLGVGPSGSGREAPLEMILKRNVEFRKNIFFHPL